MTLTDKLRALLLEETSSLVKVLRGLLEVEKSKHHIEAGYSNMLAYCTVSLKLSRSSALKRLNAARLAVRFPEILPMLQARELHLSALMMLSPHLTEENHRELFSLAVGKSERQLERILAAKFPKDRPKKECGIAWLDENTAELKLVVPAAVLEKLERVSELRKHVHPDESLVASLNDVLSDYLKKHDPLLRPTPRLRKPKAPQVHPRQIRRRIQSEVWQKDNGQCAFESSIGQRCQERAGLQIDHKQAWADGGSSLDPENLRLLCGPHNRFLSEKRFGPQKSW